MLEFIHTNADPETAVARKRTPGPTPVLLPVRVERQAGVGLSQ